MTRAALAFPARDSGQIMVLTAALTAFVLALVFAVASATSVYIDRKRLLSLADGAAVDAADALDEELYFTDPPAGDRIPISDASVDDAVSEYLDQTPAALLAEFDQLAVVEPTGTPDGTTAQVTLAAVARPPLVPWVLVPWSDGIALRVTSTARAG